MCNGDRRAVETNAAPRSRGNPNDGLHAERKAATALSLSVGIPENQILAEHVRVAVQHRTVEVLETLRVDEDLGSVTAFENLVIGRW